MVKLFTHTDLDGIGCAILGKIAFSEIEIEYCGYDDINEKVEAFLDSGEKCDQCYITDISISMDLAERITKINHLYSFRLLDHHKTAYGLNQYSWCHVREKEGDQSPLTCGTELFYHNLVDTNRISPSKALNNFAEIVRDYDTYLWKEKKDGIISKKVNDLFHLYGRD